MTDISRRQALGGIAALAARGSPAYAAPGPRYKLGVMAGMYRSVPLDDAMQRIRNAGYRYVSMVARHGNDGCSHPNSPSLSVRACCGAFES